MTNNEHGSVSEVAGTPGATSGSTPEAKDPASVVGSNQIHGSTTREVTAPQSVFRQGPFGRMFRRLHAWVPPGATEAEKDGAIRALAETMFEGAAEGSEADNPTIPSGYTYFGQFVDHDITFDPTSSLTKLNDPNRLLNFRTPRFDLDNLYGEGPEDEPFMYDQTKPGRFLIGTGRSEDEDDLPRNNQGRALIGDKRNDENTIVSQLQLAFLKLHNVIIDRVTSEEGLSGREAFTRAQSLLRFHYQHVVLFDFLPRICGEGIVRSLIDIDDPDPADVKLRFYKPKETAFIPVEFSVAAYRLGHSMVRGTYDLNRIVTSRPIFTPADQAGELDDLRGFRPLPGKWTLDWRRYLEFSGSDESVQMSRLIDSKLSPALKRIHPERDSLAALNLLRGFRMGLPSGQAVARAMRLQSRANEELGVDPALAGRETPLWLYILKEAEIDGEGGRHLGPVGARIVAEVFVGLAKHDPNSFLNIDPGWSPATAIAGGPLVAQAGPRLQLADLLRAAGLDGDPFP